MPKDTGLSQDDTVWLNRTYIPIERSADELVFATGPIRGPKYTIKDADGEGVLATLPSLLDGTQTVAEIAAEYAPEHRDDIISVLDHLVSEGVAHTGSPPKSALNDLHTQSVRAPATIDELDDLTSKSVLVIAVGDIGDGILLELRDAGVGDLRALTMTIDDGTPSPSDTTPVPDVRHISGEIPIKEAVDPVDLVIFATDQPSHPLLSDLNQATTATSTPWIPVQLQGTDGLVGPGIIPGMTGCYRCFQSRLAANDIQRIEQDQWHNANTNPSSDPPTPPGVPRVLEGFAAVHAVRMLLYGTAFIVGRVLHINTVDLGIESNEILTDPRCDICSTTSARPDTQRYITMSDLADIPEESSE